MRDLYFNKSRIIIFDKKSQDNISSNLNNETMQALQIIKKRKYDYQIKNDLLKTQAKATSILKKLLNLIKEKVQFYKGK